MYTIRPFEKTDSDYNTITAIRNAERPDEPIKAELFKFGDERRPEKFPHQRDIILHDGQAIAFGSYRQNETTIKANKYAYGTVVHGDYADKDGVQQFYLDHVLNQLDGKDLKALISSTREDRPQVMGFFEANDFKRTMRYPISELDVQAFDFSKYEDKVRALRNSGVEIVTVAELQKTHPDTWQQIYYDLDCELAKDVPSPDEYIPDSFEVFAKFVFENPAFLPEAAFFAREGERFVGMSDVWKDLSDDKRLHIGLTGVARSHRRRGIATVLKAHTAQFAKEYGADVIKTDNEENNPMYDLNMQLGYQPKPAYLDYEKPLQ